MLEKWRATLKRVSAASATRRLQRRVAGRLFFLRAAGGRPGVLMVRDADGTERVLLDPNPTGATTSTATITEFSPSPDGRLVAVNVDRGGDEVTEVSLLDVATGQPRPETAQSIWGEFPVAWMSDGSGYTYTQMAPASDIAGGDPMTNMRGRVHRLGQPVNEDPIILQAGSNARVPLLPQEFPFVDASADSDYAVAVLSGARPESRLCVAPKRAALAADAPWRCVADYTDSVQGYDPHGDTLYLPSMKGAPNGRILALDLSKRVDTRQDGSHLAMLEGYGSYGYSLQPYFDPAALEWVRAGNIYAIAHVRGGGENGNAWWLAGESPHKERAVEDLLACAAQLAKANWTTPLRTAAIGASAGGLVVGGAIARSPGQFGAAIIHAGMLNPVRLLAGQNGANQIAEFGDPRTAQGLKAMAAMDPHQRVHDGVRCPAVLFAVGLNDNSGARRTPRELGRTTTDGLTPRSSRNLA